MADPTVPGFWRRLGSFLVHLVTDSQGRPEIKAVLGGGGVITAFVWLFLHQDLGGFASIFGLSSGLLVTKTVEDSRLDSKE